MAGPIKSMLPHYIWFAAVYTVIANKLNPALSGTGAYFEYHADFYRNKAYSMHYKAGGKGTRLAKAIATMVNSLMWMEYEQLTKLIA
jgi:hypothetical protein